MNIIVLLIQQVASGGCVVVCENAVVIDVIESIDEIGLPYYEKRSAV